MKREVEFTKREVKFATKCVHAAEKPDPIFGAHTTPIFQTSTFIFQNAGQGAARFAGEEAGYIYARIPPNTPTHAVLAEKYAVLEGGETGRLLLQGWQQSPQLHSLPSKQEDHLISTDVVYGCTYSLFSEILPKLGISVSFVNTSEIENVERALKPETKMIFLETPANPTMTLCDVMEIAVMARKHGALCVVDKTLATPYFQRPLELGGGSLPEQLYKVYRRACRPPWRNRYWK